MNTTINYLNDLFRVDAPTYSVPCDPFANQPVLPDRYRVPELVSSRVGDVFWVHPSVISVDGKGRAFVQVTHMVASDYYPDVKWIDDKPSKFATLKIERVSRYGFKLYLPPGEPYENYRWSFGQHVYYRHHVYIAVVEFDETRAADPRAWLWEGMV